METRSNLIDPTVNLHRELPKSKKILDSKAWMKLWKVANKFEMKDVAEKGMEPIAVSPMKELSAFKQRASEPARKKQCIVCIEKLTNPFLCLIRCGYTSVALRRSVVKTSNGNV